MARNAKNTRMCSGCMTRRQKKELVAINCYLGTCTIDMGDKAKDGRAVYLCPDLKCAERAIKKKFLSRHLKCDIDPKFYDKIRDYIVSLCME